LQRFLAFLVCAGAGVMLCFGSPGCTDAVAAADRLMTQNDLPGAEVLFREALAADPDDLEALSGLAVVLAMQQRFDEALVYQERVVVADPDDVLTRVELGFNYLNHQGRAADAVRILNEAVELDGSAKHLSFLGQAQASAGQTGEAEATLERAIGADPSYEYSYRLLAELLEGQGRTQEAEQVISRATAQGIDISN
jgi:protein O-GlcNAc transferase